MGQLETSDTSKSLLVRLRDSDEAAWHEFFQIYTPAVYAYAIRRGLQASDAEDVTQEVLVEVARCIRNFEYQADRGRFRDWLGTVTWRRLARHWRSQSKTTELPEEPVQGKEDSEWMDQLQSTILNYAMEQIRPRFSEVTWNAFLSVWHNGKSAAQTAGEMNIPIEIVYNAKSRILKMLEAEVVRISDDRAWWQ
jgi:RNA polymerase sigma factor (sigma-70 family)